MTSVDESIQKQFASAAQAYRHSLVHAQGEDLAQIVALARAHGAQTVLDVGCGAGHVSVNIAPWAARVVAFDLTTAMLRQAQAFAEEKETPQVAACAGSAHSLPFADQRFDMAVTRYSAHHWQRPAEGIREMARVVRPGGWVIVSDIIALENYVHDTFLQTIETLRDPSHVRDFRLSEWQAFFAGAGLTMTVAMQWDLSLAFDAWVKRINTPPSRVAVLRQIMDEASAEVRTMFGITPTHFNIPGALMAGQVMSA